MNIKTRTIPTPKCSRQWLSQWAQNVVVTVWSGASSLPSLQVRIDKWGTRLKELLGTKVQRIIQSEQSSSRRHRLLPQTTLSHRCPPLYLTQQSSHNTDSLCQRDPVTKTLRAKQLQECMRSCVQMNVKLALNGKSFLQQVVYCDKSR